MQRLDEEKRTAILEAAKKRFSQYGVKKTTMQEIADDVGIAVGTLYLYFKNKNSIILAAAELYTQQHLEDTKKILHSAMPASGKLKAYLFNRFRAVQESRLSGSHSAELARVVLRLKPDLQEKEEQSVQDNVLKLLIEGIQQKIFYMDDLELDLEVFLYSIGYFFPMPTTEKYYEPDEEKLCLVVDWFVQKWCNKCLAKSLDDELKRKSI